MTTSLGAGAGPVVALAVTGLVAGALQSSLGFGASFVLVPVLGILAPELLPGTVVVAIVPLSIVMVVTQRRGLDLPAVGRITLGRLPGIALGGVVVAQLSERALIATIATVLLAAVATTAAGWQVSVTRGRELVAGALSGFTGTAAALGGPPLALLYQGERAARLRPTLAGVWLVGSVPVLASLALAGSLTLDQARVGATVGVALVVGLVLASPLVARTRDEGLRRAILAWAAIGAAATLLRAVTS